MDFLDPVDIDPRYPGRRQSKLLHQMVRNSQYESQIGNSNSRLSTYRTLQMDGTLSGNRQSVYKTTLAENTKPSRNSVYRTTIYESSKHDIELSVNKTEDKRASSGRSRSKTLQPTNSISTSPKKSTTIDERHLNRKSMCTQSNDNGLNISLEAPRAHIPTNDKSQSRKSRYRTMVSPEVKSSSPIAIKADSPSKISNISRSPNGSPKISSTPPFKPIKESSETTTNSNENESRDSTENTFAEEFENNDSIVQTTTPVTMPALTEVGDYTIKRDIGQGTFGVVKLAEHKITKQTVAIKVITKSTIKNSRARARVEQELRLLPLLDHPHIVKVYEVIEDADHYMIVMEHISGGELFQYIVKNRRVNEREARYFFRQIVSALQYCHHNSIIHRDLKPENLLLDSKMQIKLIDFGFASFYHPESTLSTFCGSPYYASPEMVRGMDYIGPEVDIWSLGVTLYTMLSGKLPFNAYNLKSFQRKVTRGEYEIPVYFSKEVTDLIRCCLNTDRRKRISIDNIRVHPWTNTGYSDLPNIHLIIRPPMVRNPDMETIKLLQPYGYSIDEVKLVLLTNNRPINPVYCLYNLLEEHKVRRQKEKAKVEKQRQRSLKRNKSLKIDTTVGNNKSTTGELSPKSPDQDESELINSMKSRRYSIDTTRDENFDDDELPLSQTPLKAAGRSFDSISRRSSVQPKILPVIVNNLNANNTDASSQGTLRNRLLMDKEPKEGWFTGLFNVSTTSTKPHQQIVQELERVMNNLQIDFQECESRFVCESKANKLGFEVRIMWKDSIKAFMICFKNLKGSSWVHKKFCYKIIQRMFI